VTMRKWYGGVLRPVGRLCGHPTTSWSESWPSFPSSPASPAPRGGAPPSIDTTCCAANCGSWAGCADRAAAPAGWRRELLRREHWAPAVVSQLASHSCATRWSTPEHRHHLPTAAAPPAAPPGQLRRPDRGANGCVRSIGSPGVSS
jgi:hypothetical protein